jgi:hypothetical protein
VFNASTVDGRFGLFAIAAAASFDDVRVKTNDPAFVAGASAAVAPMPLAEILATSEDVSTTDARRALKSATLLARLAAVRQRAEVVAITGGGLTGGFALSATTVFDDLDEDVVNGDQHNNFFFIGVGDNEDAQNNETVIQL